MSEATQTQTQTQTQPEAVEIRIPRTQFDLDSKGEVSLVKIGKFQPVATMEEFVARLGNDSNAILNIVNDGLEEYSRKALLSDSSIPWYKLTEEGDVEVDAEKNPVPFTGTLLTEEKSKQFFATVLNMAKMMFGYPDQKLPKGATKAEQDANRELKNKAKAQAQDLILSNPAAVEALKKA